MNDAFERHKGTFGEIQNVESVTEEILFPVLRNNMNEWMNIVKQIAALEDVQPRPAVLRMIVHKVCATLFWGRIKQFVKLRNSQIKVENKADDKIITVGSATQVEASRIKRKTKKCIKDDFEVKKRLRHVKITCHKDVDTYMEDVLNAEERGDTEEVKMEMKWMYEEAIRTGQLELISGNCHKSHFQKPDIWNMLRLWNGTEDKTEEDYKNSENKCCDYYASLLECLGLVNCEPENAVNNDNGNDNLET